MATQHRANDEAEHETCIVSKENNASTCDACGQASSLGRRGDAGTAYAQTWFCSSCWGDWSHVEYKKAISCGKCSSLDVTMYSERDWNWYCESCWAWWDHGKGEHAGSQRCEHCNRFSCRGHPGAPGSEYSRAWFCESCWDAFQWKEACKSAVRSIKDINIGVRNGSGDEQRVSGKVKESSLASGNFAKYEELETLQKLEKPIEARRRSSMEATLTVELPHESSAASIAVDDSVGQMTSTGATSEGDVSLEAGIPPHTPPGHEFDESVCEVRLARCGLETGGQKAPLDEYWQELWCSRTRRYFFYNTLTHDVSWHASEQVQRHINARRTWEKEHKDILSLGPFVRTTDVAVDALLSFADVDSESVLLDVGCGDGEVLRRFTRERRCRGIGLEINPFLHREAVRLGKKDKSLDFTDFRFMRAEDLDINDPAFESLTHIFLFVLDVARNEVLLRTLLHFVDQGARIITNTFELPSEHFTQIGVWPDEDTLEGAFWFLTPPFTRLFMYGKSEGDVAQGSVECQDVQIDAVPGISDKAKMIAEELQRKLFSGQFDVRVDKLDVRMLAAIQDIVETNGQNFFDRKRYSHLTIVIVIAFLTQEYNLQRVQDEYPHLLDIVMGVLRKRFPDVVLKTALIDPAEQADLDSGSQQFCGDDTGLNESEAGSSCSTGEPNDAELLVESVVCKSFVAGDIDGQFFSKVPTPTKAI